jgi:mono/diheme cytochrome c family protein
MRTLVVALAVVWASVVAGSGRLSVSATGVAGLQPAAETDNRPDPEALYLGACAACHGRDGRGASQPAVGFDLPLPDFTDCQFANREPDGDWLAVAHEGGPVRGFEPLMPAFGDALTDEELERIVAHIRSFCPDPAWPRGELNMPRALVTEKAFPEDEAVFTMGVDTDRPSSTASKLVYEKRFGANNQIELIVPFDTLKTGGDTFTGGLGDIAVGYKRSVYHNVQRGSIFSVAGEVILPTGDESEGFGSGVTKLEPFVAFGQALPGDSFLQIQAGVEVPLDRDLADESFFRFVGGRSFTQGRFGRTWSPMVELLGARELARGEPVLWDIVPQVQITLNTRQHVMFNVGVRVPANAREGRSTRVLFYILWDWFDGGFLDGW